MSRTKTSRGDATLDEHLTSLACQTESPGCDATAETRPELTFDGCGINGPDEYRTRVCTFTEWGLIANKYGPMFAEAPETASKLAQCQKLLELQRTWGCGGRQYVHIDALAETRAAAEALAEELRKVEEWGVYNFASGVTRIAREALAQWEEAKK